MSKLENAIRILKILNDYPKLSASQIAEMLNISSRSVYRYVDELTCCRYPINVERGKYGGISLDGDFKKRLNSANALITIGG